MKKGIGYRLEGTDYFLSTYHLSPNAQFPIPNSQFPIPNSQCLKNLS
ncbi:MAG: hypothetical protein V7K98_19715 [Nostoc sp.]